MKRIIAIALCLIFIFSLTACKKEYTSSGANAVDVEYYAKLGSMPETTYSLGQDVDTLKTELEEHYNNSEDHHAVFNVVEGEKTVQIDSGTFHYYYYKEKAADGVSYIVSFDKAFGFDVGTVSVEITDALNSFKYTEEDFNEDNSFFVLGINSGKVIKYKFAENTVSFVFVDDALYATALYKTNDWE